MKITDTNNDLVPDSEEQLKNIIKYGINNGISSEGDYSFDPLWFQRYFLFNENLDNDFTSILMVFLSGTRTEDASAKRSSSWATSVSGCVTLGPV